MKPRIHTNQRAANRVWERLAPAMDRAGTAKPTATLHDYFDLHELDTEMEADVAGLSLRCRFTNHLIPTIGLLISDGQATLGWSGDTPFDEQHIQWLSQADVIVHETGRAPAHTPIEHLSALPDDVRRKMRLIHLEDDFDTETTDIKPLKQGEVLEL